MAMKYTLCENDGSGGSRLTDVTVEQHYANVVDGEGPLYVSAPLPATSVIFVEIPEERESDWHNAPERQFVVVLSGVIESETTDGQTRRFGPGDMTLAADVDGKGHTGRVIEAPLRVLFITLPDN